MIEMALRVTMRSDADASALAYQAESTVRRNTNASAATTVPAMVRKDRVLLRRKALRSAKPVSVT
jgi:hypothetical protein